MNGARGDIVDGVLIKDGKLWSKIGDEIDEYLALGGEEFFIKPDLSSVMFTRDARNIVIGYVLRRSEWSEHQALLCAYRVAACVRELWRE